MRAGASVNDVMGGMFGVIAIQAALAERQTTGRGRHIQSALFENNVFLIGQAMMFETVTGTPSIPYSVKDSPWPVYDLFDTKDGTKLFVTVVGEEQWRGLLPDLRQARNGSPIRGLRPTRAGSTSARGSSRRSPASCGNGRRAELAATLERLELPFAPVNKPGDLFDDPHLAASGGLLDIRLPDGRRGQDAGAAGLDRRRAARQSPRSAAASASTRARC